MTSTSKHYQVLADSDLLLYLAEGDKLAFTEIYRRYWKKLYNETFKRLRDATLVEEIVQDIFTNLWLKHETLHINHVYPYLLMSMRYKTFEVYRKQQGHTFFEIPLNHDFFSTEEADSKLRHRELTEQLDLWLGLEPDKRAAIFKLHHLNDKSTREIAQILGISQKTVQNQLLNALNSLKAYVERFF